jgi:hypothetical protein
MKELKERSLLQIANILGLIGMIAVNILANALPLGGKTTGELSDAYPNLFVPAGYVFSIWGVIYLLLIAFTVYQASPSRKNEEFIQKIGYLFVLSSAFNIVWIFLWHYENVLLSLFAMFALLLSLIVIYLQLDIGRGTPTREERLRVHLPFSVYLGWITVAPIANVVAVLVSIGWNGFGISEVTWTILVIAVAIALTIINTMTRGDSAYALVIIWALGGIIVKQIDISAIMYTAGLGIVTITLFLIYKLRT